MIDWSAAPEWAQYHAVDANRVARWWESKPRWDGHQWVHWAGLADPYSRDRSERCAVDGGTPGTLTKRPDAGEA